MPLRMLLPIAAVLLSTAGCGYGAHGTSGRSASFGRGSQLDSHYVIAGDGAEVPVCHVLFVPQWDEVRVDHGFATGNGGDDRHHTFRYAYREQGLTIMEVEPIEVFGRSALKAGGRWFDLDDGNVFMVGANRDGSVRVAQLPRLEGVPSSNQVLAHVKAGLPNDRRVQALRASTPFGARQPS